MATWANTTLCTLSQVQDRLATLGVMLPSENATNQSNLYDDKYTVAKRWIASRLKVKFKKSYSGTPSQWRTQLTYRYDEQIQKFSWANHRDNGITPNIGYGYGYSFGDGNWYELGLLGTNSLVSPITFYNSGVPTNGTSGAYANIALNGDFLVNTNRNGYLYINRGTSASPLWERFLTDDLINYVLNPTELLDAAISAVIYAIAVDRAIPRDMNTFADLDALRLIKEDCRIKWFEDMAVAETLIQIDESGDGIVSNYELDMQDTSEGWGFVA